MKPACGKTGRVSSPDLDASLGGSAFYEGI